MVENDMRAVGVENRDKWRFRTKVADLKQSGESRIEEEVIILLSVTSNFPLLKSTLFFVVLLSFQYQIMSRKYKTRAL